MKIFELQHGQTSVLELAASHGTFSSSLDAEHEVHLRFSNASKEPLLSYDGSVDEVQPVDDASRRLLEDLRQTNPPRLIWVVARKEQRGKTRLMVQVHRFRSEIQWDESFALGVDERIVDRVSQRVGRSLDVDQVCEWLEDEILLDVKDYPERYRAIVTGEPEQPQFRLLGRRFAVDVRAADDILIVDRLAPLQSNPQKFRSPETLFEAKICFVDHTIAGAMRPALRESLKQIAGQQGSYLNLWLTYQELERRKLVEQAQEVGWVEYSKFESLPSGEWKFEIEKRKYLNDLHKKVANEEEVYLETAKLLPSELVDGTEQQDPPSRAAVGELVRIDLKKKVIVLKPFDEDSEVVPPQNDAYLFLSLQGDRTRLKRREDAMNRLTSAEARLPQLGAIIAGAPASVRRLDAIQPLKQAILDELEFPPTDKQREAIDKALNTPDIAVIQGPPGTGKTTVIAAIQSRLALLGREQPEIAGRTLLTSFQHDAVDHAAASTRVFGLPPSRYGGRRGSNSGDDNVERWARESISYVDAQLAGLGEERPLTLFRDMCSRVAEYAAGAMADDEVQELLLELAEQPAGTLPDELQEELRSLSRRPAQAGRAGDLDRELMRRAVRGLRVSQVAFTDDGPRKARAVLRRVPSLLRQDESTLLQRAANTERGEPFDDIEQLASLRDVLLDRLAPDEIDGEQMRVDPDILTGLNKAISHLRSRLEHSPAGLADALQAYRDTLKGSPREAKRTLEEYASVYAATCQQSVSHMVVRAKGGEHVDLIFDNVIVDEAARANPLDLFIPMTLAKRRVLLVGDHRQLPHLLEPDVESELSNTLDQEAKKALKNSLFERLFKDLQRRQKTDGICRVVTLDQQFRMHPTLGDFVCEVFYEPHGEGFESPLPADKFAHQVDGYMKAGRPVCAAWKDVPLKKGKERDGRSKSRRPEATWIAGEVHRLLEEQHVELSIGIITFYRSQFDELMKALEKEGLAARDPETNKLEVLRSLRSLERSDGSVVEGLRVGTVDSFQGMEFDVVFLSVTRCNDHGDETEKQLRRKYGHLLLANRLCVAMSRQRRLLVAVGDRQMFATESAREHVPGLAKFLENICGGEDGLVIT